MNKKMIRKASSILLSMCMVAALFSCKDSAATQAWLESQAQEASKSLPMEIDTNKILDKMVAPGGNVFQYEFTLSDVDKLADRQDFEKSTKNSLLAILKDNEAMNEFREKKVALTYLYKNKYQQVVAEVKIKSSEY